MVKIKFTCVVNSNKLIPAKVFEFDKDIDVNQGLRSVCKGIYLELIANRDAEDYVGGLEATDFFGLNISLKQKDTEKQSFPNFRLGSQGEILFFSGINGYLYDWTLKELLELREAGYLKGEKDEIIFESPFIGFGSASILPLIEDIVTIVEAVGLVYRGLKWGKTYISERELKKEIILEAHKWEEKQGIYSVPQLRNFIEEHGPWTIGKLKQALQIKEEFACLLLYSLGYDPQGDIWVARVSEDGLKRYTAWIEGEKEAVLQTIEERNKNFQE